MSAFTISLATLKRTEGAAKSFTLEAEFPDEIVVGLMTLPKGRTIRVHGDLQSVGDGVLVLGEVRTTLDYQCSRCLKQGSQDFQIDIQELYVYPEREAEYEDEDVRHIDHDSIDLEEAARDAIILEQPLSPLCTEECPGLCLICGVDMNQNPDHNHDDVVDSRWLSLAEWAKMS
ncbi:MAG: DUF177 domain-containing protein [Propionibacteriaceae bacterium]|jgi:uncharacterized protein|nr:DUF177 domain-containing protein [Propionibacteriaceae bacterium]